MDSVVNHISYFSLHLQTSIMDIILLNGPRGSGKSLISAIIAENHRNVLESKFAKPIDDIAQVILAPDEIDYHEWREGKKEEQLLNYPTTMRKLLIGISEHLIKPQLGDNYFAHRAADLVISEIDYANSVTGQQPYFSASEMIVFSDCGFQNEHDAFREVVLEHDSSANIQLINVRRQGRTFKGDSREWVKHEDSIDIYNNSTKDDLRTDVISTLGRLT